MEKYRLVEEHKGDDVDEFQGEASSTEVRITQQGKPRNYISYAMSLFVSSSYICQGISALSLDVITESNLTYLQSEGSKTITLKAMGRAINKAVTIAEILKRKMPLHQVTTLSSCEMIDVFEPIEEGLDVVTSRRYVSCMKITLSLDGSGIDMNDIGYQPPLPMREIQPGDTNPLQSPHIHQSQKHQQPP